jgi:spermidine synthase
MAAMVLLSVALIAYQVAVIQLLSYVQWYHYANMVISIALLGFGAAGTLLALKRNWLLKHSDALLPLLMIFSGLMMAGAVELGHNSFTRFDSYLLFTDRLQWVKLLANSLLYFIPFFLGALALGMVFIKYVHEIGSFYFANLAGSGIGAVLAAVLAWYFFPASLPSIMALFAVMAGLLLLKDSRHWYIILLALPVVVFIFYRTTKPVSIQLSQYKSLSKTMNLPSARIALQKPGPYGLVQLVSADALRYAPGLSLAFDKEVPVKNVLFSNGDWYGPIDSWDSRDSFHLLDYTTMAIPYVLKKRNRILVLNAGTGLHVSHALSRGVTQIDAVEPHQAVHDLLMNELAAINDSIMYRRKVKMHNTEPRVFLSANNKKYDLIQLPMAGSFGGGVGLYAMREEYGLTKEAFLRMWHSLEEDGVISITAWIDYPFRNSLKIAATLAEVLNEVGIDDTRLHIAAVRSWGTISFLLKKTPLTVNDTSELRKFFEQLSFDSCFPV